MRVEAPVGLAIIVFVGLLVWWLLDRSTELFCLSWRSGELRLVRGRIPPALKRDLAEALAHMKVQRATVRARKDDARARLTASGVDDFAEQRLRNIFQIYPLSQLRQAVSPTQNRLLRWLGVASLVWLFGRRDD